jgi:hypothetical protein
MRAKAKSDSAIEKKARNLTSVILPGVKAFKGGTVCGGVDHRLVRGRGHKDFCRG